MKTFFRVGIVSGALSLSLLAAGCAEDNESTAGITGKAPENAPKSQVEMKSQMKGSGVMPSTYPGAARRGRTGG